jgi:hypothetical protein
MKGRGIQIEFIKDKPVEGYYTKIEELDGNKYAVIESKGTRYMLPFEKQFDQVQMHRHVSFDGHKMQPSKAPLVNIKIGKGIGFIK